MYSNPVPADPTLNEKLVNRGSGLVAISSSLGAKPARLQYACPAVPLPICTVLLSHEIVAPPWAPAGSAGNRANVAPRLPIRRPTQPKRSRTKRFAIGTPFY